MQTIEWNTANFASDGKGPATLTMPGFTVIDEPKPRLVVLKAGWLTRQADVTPSPLTMPLTLGSREVVRD